MALQTGDGSSEYEGYLEKHATGTVSKFLGKQKKNLCFLQGSWLYCHQSNKRSSVVSSIDLSEAQMIRKVNTDKTSTQFEIATKFKNILFTASSAQECNEWVKNLQRAMTLKDGCNTSNTSNQPRRVNSMNDYQEVDILKEEKTPLAIPSEYEDIDDYRSEKNDNQTTLSEQSDYASDYMDNEVFTSQDTKVCESSASDINKPNFNETDPKVEYAEVIPKELRTKNNNNSGMSENNSKELSCSDEESIDDIQLMIPNAFPALDFKAHIINEDDDRPILDLKKFLSSNNLERKSHTLQETNDPIEILKTYLQSLDL